MAQHTSLGILFIIFLLTLEIVLIILAVCLCMLQRTRTDKTSRHRTVIVREKDRGWDRRGRSGAGCSEQFQP